jgi:hydrophobe/amphiphile efflux-1 (HAE1) family protein
MMLSDLSIRRPVFAWMLMFGLIVFGAISLSRLGVSYMPDVDFPVININVIWEGSAPELIEAEIIDVIEEKIIALEGVNEVRSNVRLGTANITVEFDIKRDVDAALQEVQAAVSTVRLPMGVDAPTLSKSNPEDESIMFVGIASDRPLIELMKYVDLNLRDQFQVLPGVGEVTTPGFVDRNLRLWIDKKALRKFELTVLDVQQAIQLQNIEVAAGYMENAQQELNVRTMGEGATAEAVGNILIARRGGQAIYDSTIRIKDVARVEDGINDTRNFLRFDQQNAVALGIKKQRGTNEVTVADNVYKKVEELKKTLPKDIRIRVNVDFTRFVKQAIYFSQKELVTAAIVTSILCFLFLGSWTASVNVLMSIPTSIMGTFTVLYFMGFTLNLFTLLALALVIGIVVDDAIMVLENIIRHFHMGKDKVTASREGASEIAFAAIATSAAVIAIFLPVAFMTGVIGKFFFQFSITITAAVALSLLEAVTLTPMRCSQMLQRSARPNLIERSMEKWFAWLGVGYRATLEVLLRHRWKVVFGSLALFLGSLLIFKGLRQEFVPAQDQSFFRIRMETPVGSSLASTYDKVLEVEKYIAARPEVARSLLNIGGFSAQSNQAVAPVILVEKDQREKSQQQIMNEFRTDLAKIPGLRIFLEDLSQRGLNPRQSKPIEFNIRGSDYDKMREFSRTIMDKMKASGEFVDVNSTFRDNMPELQIIPKRDEAARRGVSMETIARTVNLAIGGVREGKFTGEGRRYDTRLRLAPEERLQPEDVLDLQVRTDYGELVNLSTVADINVRKTVLNIQRVNRQRAIGITANIAQGKSQATALSEVEKISRETLTEGYSFNLEGGSQSFKESFNSLFFVLILGVIVAYMVLASQFNSFIHPFTVLIALPFSITGAALALQFSNNSVNLFSMIGIILLTGIAKKNSIMLVEFTNKIREQQADKSVIEALLEACPIRLRPILMTSAATIGAAVPVAMTNAPGSETRVPMALVIIGGVLVSTLLTLYVVPCVYSLFSRLEKSPAVVEEGLQDSAFSATKT